MPANGGFLFTDSDLQLVQDAYELKVSTIDHLAALAPAPSQSAREGRSHKALRRRLRKLKHQGYLVSVARFLQKHVYAIGPAALPVLGLPEKRLRHHEVKELFLQHELAITRTHTRMLLETRGTPFTILLWDQDRRALLNRTRALGPDGKSHIFWPDARFVLQHRGLPEGRNKWTFFLEQDRSTERHDEIKEKIAASEAWFTEGGHTSKYGIHRYRIVFVTETRERADRLATSLAPLIANQPIRRTYQCIAFEDLTLNALLPGALSTTLESPAANLPIIENS